MDLSQKVLKFHESDSNLISELLENDRSHLCGEPNQRDSNRHLARWGYKESSVYPGGEKYPLGFWEGSTESSENVTALLRDLEARGFKIHRDQLFILDGGGGMPIFRQYVASV